MRVGSLAQEDPLEKETSVHSSILAWEIPWTEEPGGLQSVIPQRFGHNWVTDHACSSHLHPILNLCNESFRIEAHLPKTVILISGLPWGLSGKESTCQCRRHRFNPQSRKIPHALVQLRLYTATLEPVFQSAGAVTIKAYMLHSLCFATSKPPR